MARGFIKGPIPALWLYRAARLPGKSLHVAMALWEIAGLAKRRDQLTMSAERLARYGVSRYAARRALLALEEARLVEVARLRGKAARVTIVNDALASDATSDRQEVES